MTNSKEISFYWQYYGLVRDPFSAVRDDAICYTSPEWQQQFELLNHLIQSKNGLLAVIGEEGSGKTTFAHRFIRDIGDSMQVHQFETDSFFSTKQLASELEDGFNLKTQDHSSPKTQLDSQIASIQSSNKKCLLVIDNAQFLPLETLNTLLSLLKKQSNNKVGLHILLFGDKHLQEKLANLAKHELSGDLIHSVVIEPLTLEETDQYLQYRFSQAGLTGPMPLTQVDIEQIHSESKGIPDSINRLTQQILLDSLTMHQPAKQHSGFKQHQTKIISGALIVIALASAYTLLSNHGDYQKQAVITFADHSESLRVPRQQTQVVKPKQTVEHKQTAQQKQPVEPKQTVVQVQSQSQPKAIAKQQPSKAVQQEFADKKAQIDQVVKATKEAQQREQQSISKIVSIAPKEKLFVEKPVAVKPEPAVVKSEPTVIKTKAVVVKSVSVSTKVVAAAVKPVPTSSFPRRRESSLHSNVEPKVVNQSVDLKVQKRAVTKTVSKNSYQLSAAEKNIMKIDSRYYTLQVLGVSTKLEMTRFVSEKHLQNDTFYFHTQLHGKPWYILIYGKYKTQQAALAAIKDLPKALQAYKPWPRSYSGIQQSLRSSR